MQMKRCVVSDFDLGRATKLLTARPKNDFSQGFEPGVRVSSRASEYCVCF